jgi:hypothetical protein
VQTMAVLGVDGRHVLRVGSVHDEILAELATGGYDLLVLGAPLGLKPGHAPLAGMTSQVLSAAPLTSTLIVRSGYAGKALPRASATGRTAFAQEVP